MNRTLLIVEFVVLYVACPLAYRYSPWRLPALPLLWLITGYAGWQLGRTPGFDRTRLWNAAQLGPSLPSILAWFAVGALLLWLAVRVFAPQLQWNLVRERPVLWGLVMVAYPVLSVYPQGVLYRVFFFERYATLFPGHWTMIVASALAFAFVHIIFRNPVALGLTLVGGVLFAMRYAETGSLLTSSVEHALYGAWLFTVGLGACFYHGTLATVGSVMRR
jgi:hypothetical protein